MIVEYTSTASLGSAPYKKHIIDCGLVIDFIAVKHYIIGLDYEPFLIARTCIVKMTFITGKPTCSTIETYKVTCSGSVL